MIHRVLIFLALLCGVANAQAQTAAEHILQGRIAFEQRNIGQAETNFLAALSKTPHDPTANAFYAATRLLALTKDAEFHALLDRLGVTETNRDVFAWSAEFKTNALGEPITAENLNANEVVTYLHQTVVPQLEGALTNLAMVPQDFLLNLTAAEAFSTEPVTMDYADFVLIRGALEAAQYFIYTLASWNFDVAGEALRALSRNDRLSIEEVLKGHPQLLTIASTNDLGLAKQAFVQSISEYMVASLLIRSRPTNVVRLFNLDAEMAEDERRFRVTLQDILESVDARVRLAENADVTVYAGAHFASPKGLREVMPEFAGNDVIAGTFPDASFGNVLGGVESYKLDEGLNDLNVEVSPRLIPVRSAANRSIGFTMTAVDGEPLYLLRSLDLKKWDFLGVIYPTNGLVTITEPFSVAAGPQYYRTAFGIPVLPVFYAPPLTEEALTEQNKTYQISLAGGSEPVLLTFPAGGSYQRVGGNAVETGTYSDARHFLYRWTIRFTPAAGQPGARAGEASLEFTAADAGTWTFVPEMGAVENGTFVVTAGGNPGGDAELTGKRLRISYHTGGAETFDFTSATSVSYENGVLTGTYDWSAPERLIHVTLSNGWMYSITIPVGTDATVFFRYHSNDPGETGTGSYTLQ